MNDAIAVNVEQPVLSTSLLIASIGKGPFVVTFGFSKNERPPTIGRAQAPGRLVRPCHPNPLLSGMDAFPKGWNESQSEGGRGQPKIQYRSPRAHVWCSLLRTRSLSQLECRILAQVGPIPKDRKRARTGHKTDRDEAANESSAVVPSTQKTFDSMCNHLIPFAPKRHL